MPKARTLYLCARCADKYRAAYDVAEVPQLSGVAYSPGKASCEDCRKRVIGTYYTLRIKEKTTHVH